MFRLSILLWIALFAFLAAPAQSKEDLPKLLQKLLGKITDEYEKYGMDGIIKNLEDEWSDFRKSFGKEYAPEEDAFRRSQFERNKKTVEKINKLHAQGKLSYEAALNEHSDLTKQEYLNLNGDQQLNETEMEKFANHSRRMARAVDVLYNKKKRVPSSINWVDKGLVTGVKDQGKVCRSCWAFGAAGALEAFHKMYNGKLLDLSQQNLLDCSWEFDSHGCDGGSAVAAYRWAHLHGINAYKDYPYVANSSRQCKQNLGKSFAKTDGFIEIPQGDELAMKIALATLGPYSVSVDASLPGFNLYKQGVYADPDCSPFTSHTVLLVGYGTDKKYGDYWIIKNSWGVNWGMKGYGYIARNQDNMCGIAQFARAPYRIPF